MKKCRTDAELDALIDQYVEELKLTPLSVSGIDSPYWRKINLYACDPHDNRVAIMIGEDNNFFVLASSESNNIQKDIRQLGVMLAMGRGA